MNTSMKKSYVVEEHQTMVDDILSAIFHTEEQA
jgi:hypothetical protein